MIDEMKIRSKLMRGIVSKLIGVALKKKFGFKIDVRINEIEVTVDETEKAHIHLNVDAETAVDNVKKFTKFIGLEEDES